MTEKAGNKSLSYKIYFSLGDSMDYDRILSIITMLTMDNCQICTR